MSNLICWKCGASLAKLALPPVRGAECPACYADIHVCRMCRFYEPNVANECGELIAEPVSDKEHANFCDYFQARPNAYTPAVAEQAAQARAALAALFGLESVAPVEDPARLALEKLFIPTGDSH